MSNMISELAKWIHDDICWCANSEECPNTECERHTSNRLSDDPVYTAAYFKNTDMCPYEQRIKKGQD